MVALGHLLAAAVLLSGGGVIAKRYLVETDTITTNHLVETDPITTNQAAGMYFINSNLTKTCCTNRTVHTLDSLKGSIANFTSWS